MPVLIDWVNDYYLEPRTISAIRESVLAKPDAKYAVLDGFFKTEKLNELIRKHANLEFSEEQDRRASDGTWLPYDGAVCFARKDQHFGSDLFFSDNWHAYCADLVGTRIKHPCPTEVKLRHHRPYADGFWIHTDFGQRQMVIITYFNKNWKFKDGGLLQLWRIDEGLADHVFEINDPKGRMDFLAEHKRIRTSSPGGGFADRKTHDLVLIDQIVPVYNRVFMCDFQSSPAFHSVTPSNSRERTGFVQWLLENQR